MVRCPPAPKIVKPTLANLSMAERLVVARRRAGQTQEDLRASLGLTRRGYQRLETDALPAKAWKELLGEHPGLAALVRSVEHLDAHEKCFLSRQRANLTQEEVGRRIGYQKFWVGMMEHGRARPDALVSFWNN